MTFGNKRRRRRAKEDRLKEHREFLVHSVRRHILPELIELGFATSKATSESFDIFPPGGLRRTRPDGKIDLVEVQFMSYGRAAFRINACTVPKEGIMTLGGRRTADEIDAGGLHEHFELYASPRWWRWFSLRFWRFRSASEADYESLARSVATMLPEVDMALYQGKLGPHIRRITFD